MTEQPTAPEPSDHGGIGSFISIAAIIVAALAAATTALIRPYLEASTDNTVFVAVFISVATTTSTTIYKACAGEITKITKIATITKSAGGRRWRLILFAGLLAGLAACLLGIGVTSGAELAMGKEPSISPNGTQVIPISPPPAMGDSPAMGEEPSISPNGTPPPPPPLISYYYDSDGDTLGAGSSVKYERGSQPSGWVEQSGDKCPDIPGPPNNEGCPPPPPPPPKCPDIPGPLDNKGCPVQRGSPANSASPATAAATNATPRSTSLAQG